MTTNFDDQLKHVLRERPLDQPGLIEMAASNFRGRQRYFNMLTVLVSLLMLAGMVACARAFFTAMDIRDMILYATVFLMLSGAISMLKLWFWLMMIRYSLARDLKRLELRLSLHHDSLSDQ